MRVLWPELVQKLPPKKGRTGEPMSVKLKPMSPRERRILITLGLLLPVVVAYPAARLAFPELWAWS
jgi:type II secretory pathway component PulM